MRKILCNALFLVLFVLMIICGAGCNRAERGMKGPNIKKITRQNVHGVFAPTDEHIWLTGNHGSIYHSGDGGETWKAQESGMTEGILVDGVFLDTRTAWIVGLYGTVLHTTDGGARWTRQQTGTKRHLFGISFADAEHGWAVGEWGTTLHTSDGGKSWQTQREEMDRTFNNVCFLDRETGWIVGERGTILHTRDGGKSWQPQLPKVFEREDFEAELENPPPSLFGVFFTDRDHGWACGIDGTIITTNNGGNTWELQDSKTDMTLYTIVIKWGRGWVVGDKGTYLTSPDAGATWVSHADVIKSRQPFRDIYFSSPQKGWVVGAAGTVVHTADGGQTWDFRSGLSYAMDFFQMPEALEFKGRVME
ncbi:MAG: hypothetical protein GY868_02640 [Deltaproteobacteria bacterium]|nr:hypothetical protein [Deltaproteobacteria bacterium]